MKLAKTEAEVNEFKEGIVRILSNFTLYKVKQDYIDNKELFDAQAANYNIHDHGDELEEPLEGEDDEDVRDAASKFPLF